MNKVFVFIALVPVLIFADSKIDSLKMELANSDSLAKILVLINLADYYINFSIDTCIHLAKEGLILSKKNNYDIGSAKSSYILGKAYNIKGNYSESQNYLISALEEYRKMDMIEDYLFPLYELGRTKFLTSKYGKALIYFEEMLKLSKNIKNIYWEAIALDAMGSIYNAQSLFEKALQYHYRAQEYFEQIENEKLIAGSLYSIGADYNGLSKYDKAIEYYLNSIVLYESIKDEESLAMSKHAIGMTYQDLKNNNQALKYNFQALNLAQKYNNNYLISSILSNIGLSKMSIAQQDSALQYFKKGLAIDQKIAFKPGIAFSFDNIGNVYYDRKDYSKALEYYTKAWSIAENLEEIWRKTRILNHLGLVNLRIGRKQEALVYLKKSLKYAEEIKAQDLVQESFKSLSEYYAECNNYKNAYIYLTKFSQLNDSIITASSHKVAEMQMRYETGKQEKEKKLLQNEIDLQKFEIEKSKLKSLYLYTSLILAFIIGFFAYSRYRVKNKANKLLEIKIKEALKKQEEQQQIIFHQASLSSLGELAAGMAHEINQPLQDIKLCTESLEFELKALNLDNPSLKENIAEIYQDIDRIRNIVQHVRIFSSQQKNHVEELFEIKTVIEDALSMIGKQYLKNGITINLELKDKIGQIKGNPYKFEQVVINFMSNAKDALMEKEQKIKEAYTKQIFISTARDENDIIFKIKDNGIGMEAEQKENIFRPFFTTKKLGEGTGLGLSIVYGIIKDMKGSISVESQYYEGTTIEVRIPIVIAGDFSPNY
jgi:two-component system NtrC family sensor kinase